MSDKPELRPFDPENAGNQDYPITCYQPVYYVSKSFRDMSEKMIEYAKFLGRPFDVEWQPSSHTVRTVPPKHRPTHKQTPRAGGTTSARA